MDVNGSDADLFDDGKSQTEEVNANKDADSDANGDASVDANGNNAGAFVILPESNPRKAPIWRFYRFHHSPTDRHRLEK
jgi:hypothetical protein